jgi:hypothetical protein
MDDLGIAIAQAQADTDQAQSDYDSICPSDPDGCQSPGADNVAPDRSSGGPMALDCGPCSERASDAVVNVVLSAGTIASTYLSYSGAVASGLALTTAGWAVAIGIVATAGFAAGYYVGKYVNCIRALPQGVANQAITEFVASYRLAA